MKSYKVTYEEFSRQISEANTFSMKWGCGALGLAPIVGITIWWFGATIGMAVMCSFVPIVIYAFVFRIWREQKFNQLPICEGCKRRPTVDGYFITLASNVCVNCGCTMFACKAKGVLKDLGNERENSSKLSNSTGPKKAKEPKQAEDASNGLVAIGTTAKWLFNFSYTRVWAILASDTSIQAFINRQHSDLGLPPIEESETATTISSVRRLSWLWVACVLAPPVTMYLVALAGAIFAVDETERLGAIIGVTSCAAIVFLPITILGYVFYMAILALSPAWVRNWFNGGQEIKPMEVDEEAADEDAYITILPLHNNEAVFHQPELQITYTCEIGGDVLFCLVNRETKFEYQVAIELKPATDFRSMTFRFAPHLRCDAPKFLGDEIRIRPDKDMSFKIYNKQISFPVLQAVDTQ